MSTKKFVLTSLVAMMSFAPALSQDFFDITENYIQNADFTANIDYGLDAAEGNVKNNTLNTPQGWAKNDGASATLAVAATFQYGTKATFGNKSIPATGPDGTADGACLTLCAAFGNSMAFSQVAKMPAGNYKLLVTYYNCNADAQTVVANLCGWYVSADDHFLSAVTDFGTGEWRTDTIAFTLNDAVSGRLQIGITCTGATAKNAMLAIDNVRLLRDTPYGPQDDLVPAPEVVTDPRFARGATMAFGRIRTATGEGITERGFCWGETPEPTIGDNTTTEYLTNNGNIYWLKDLKPATLYYMRAYAKNSYGKVGYGDAIKFYTLPKGQIKLNMRDGGDQTTYNRIKNASETAINWWNNLTEIKDFSPSVGFVDGTPTADCSYGGWIRVGSNTSYQRTGTIMHEMLHGVGVIPWADTEWSRFNLRSGTSNAAGFTTGSGQWLGDRVTEVLRFWDNSTTSVLNGDYQHLWPYGINGASEDNGSDVLYIGNSLVCQALGEDGLQHTSSHFAEPYYAFDQEDDTKYYLKCEDEERGLFTSYLIPTGTGILKWRAMTAAEVQANDSAAWYITFTPSNQYYQLRNAATGQYLTYSGSFKTAAHATPTAADNFHFMRGRVDVASAAENVKRGYWIIHPTDNWTPPCMQANANGAVGGPTFDISNAATKQRWLILTAGQATQMEEAAVMAMKNEVNALLANIKTLALVPHKELKAGTDDTYAAAIADIEKRAAEATRMGEVVTLQDEAEQAAFTFLCNVCATDRENPFDLTYKVKNPGMDSTDGWTGSPTLDYSCAEFYQTAFNFYQNIANLPGGEYQVLVQGFQRPGTSANAYNDFVAGNNKVTASLYAGNVNNDTLLVHIATGAQTKKVGAGSEATVGSTLYVPQTMQAAAAYFAKGLYENSIGATVDSDGSTLRIGIRATSQPDSYWTIFDNFRLHFFGKAVSAIPGDVNNDNVVDVADIAAIISVMASTAETQGGTANPADVNGDGTVDVADISTVISIMAVQ